MDNKSLVLITIFHLYTIVISGTLKNKLLVVSLDGFRADYLTKVNLSHLKKMMETGVSPKFVKSSFVTKTFPTHMSIATGLNQESHGIISNNMWDRATGKSFSVTNNSTRDPFWFQFSYPVWMTAEDNNIKSGIFFWPGSEVTYDNKRPSKYKHFDLKVTMKEIINNITRWLIYDHIDLAFMYFYEPDMTSHKFGPYANETIQKVQEMDQCIGYLMNILNSSSIKDNINVIVVSDHGMSEQKIFINFIFPIDIKNLIEKSTDLTPMKGIFAKHLCKDLLYRNLKDFFKQYTNVKLYVKEEFLQRFHYSNNSRIPDILIVGDKNVVLVETDNQASEMISSMKGNHGYDNDDENMNSFLVAKGPDFRQLLGVQSEPINQTDIYHVMCALLKIHPKPNNGTLAAVKMFLVDSVINDYMKILNIGTIFRDFTNVYVIGMVMTLYIVLL